jgi:hypothetical protein
VPVDGVETQATYRTREGIEVPSHVERLDRDEE